MRHDRVDIDRTHAFADGALHAQQANAVLVFHQFANRTHATVAKVVDVVNRAATVLQFAHDLDGAQDVFLAQDAHRIGHVHAKAHVHLHAANGGQVITIGIEEQAGEHRFRRLGRRRLTGAHDTIDVGQRLIARGVLVHGQRIADPRAIGRVHRQGGQRGQASFLKFFQLLLGQFVTGFGKDLARVFVDDVGRDETPDQPGRADQHFLGGFCDLADHARGQLRIDRGDFLTRLGIDQRLKQLHATEGIGIKTAGPALFRLGKLDLAIEVAQDLVGIHATDFHGLHVAALGGLGGAGGFGCRAFQCVQQRGDRQLALAVDADVDQVLAVEFEIEPRPAIGNDARGEQELARRMGLALVMIEEHAGAAVHLADDDTLGPVDDKGAVIGHERHVAHVNRLFLDIADRA